MAGNELMNYGAILKQLKEKIKAAQTKAVLAVNNELLKVYWEIGNVIFEQEKESGWGGKVIEKLAGDLKMEFPEMKGLSPRNLRYMRDFSIAYPQFTILQQAAAKSQISDNQNDIILQQAAAKLPWGHHQLLLDKVKTVEERRFYIQKCAEIGWSRNIMLHQIESGLYNRQGALTNNFDETLPAYQNELTKQLFKDPYNLDFIMLGEEAKERDLEDALMTHVTKLLLELGDGFAFMGRQRRFEAGGREFFIDLLFYHTKLRRHIIIELKIGEFEPEYVSKMNLYLGLADDQLKGEFDQPAIGLILCKTKNKIVAEYALRDTSKPIGIAEYKISQMLPEDIKGELPSIEDIEHKLDEEINENLNPVDARLKSIKEKIKSLNTPVIQTECTHQILQNIFDNGLKPLYQKIIQKFNSEFGAEFLSQQLNWRVSGKIVYGIDDLVNILKEEKDLTKISEIEFNYTFLRFKRGGTEDLNEHITLKFTVSSTWYGFSIVNYNNQQPFLKKMYHEDITVSDHQLIMDLMVSKVLDQIEWMIEKINGTK
jgi:predicted nuclease of restriction endonuclease-like (RecB) superfamily